MKDNFKMMLNKKIIMKNRLILQRKKFQFILFFWNDFIIIDWLYLITSLIIVEESFEESFKTTFSIENQQEMNVFNIRVSWKICEINETSFSKNVLYKFFYEINNNEIKNEKTQKSYKKSEKYEIRTEKKRNWKWSVKFRSFYYFYYLFIYWFIALNWYLFHFSLK